MSATTLPIVNAPTLQGGMVELLHLADALQGAAELGCGVTVWRDEDGRLESAEPDRDVPAGVVETATQVELDPWAPTAPEAMAAAARLELLELLAHVTTGDIVATADRVQLL